MKKNIEIFPDPQNMMLKIGQLFQVHRKLEKTAT